MHQLQAESWIPHFFTLFMLVLVNKKASLLQRYHFWVFHYVTFGFCAVSFGASDAENCLPEPTALLLGVERRMVTSAHFNQIAPSEIGLISISVVNNVSISRM